MRFPPQFDEMILRALAKDPDGRQWAVPEHARLRQGLEQVPLEEPWDSDKAEAWWGLHVGPNDAETGLAAHLGVAVPTAPPGAGQGAGDLLSAGRAAG